MQRTEMAIKVAFDKGYRVTDAGVLIGTRGVPLKVSKIPNQPYPTFSVNLSDKLSGIYSIPVHRFAGYCFYGELIFDTTLCVRHKSGDVMDYSRSNLLLGTYSENQLDKPPEVRQAAAKAARAAQPPEGNTAELTAENVLEIRSLYSTLPGVRARNGFATALAERFGVDRNAISSAAYGRTWKHLLPI